VTPPVTREHVSRGAFHGYKPFFTASECPGVPKELYVEALRAEGVAVEMPVSAPFRRARQIGHPVTRSREAVHVPQSQRNRDITELPGPVGLGPEAAAGDSVMKPRGHLIDPVPLAEDIDNQGGFHAPAPGQAAA
jgi:hypothetical protein